MAIPEETLGFESPQDFAKRNQLQFDDSLLLSRALTHRSYLNEHPEAIEDNERLEFLGDAVLDYVVGAWLYNRFPEMAEGELTRLRAALVKTDQLAEFGQQIELGRALRLGRGEEENGGRRRRAMLCGAYEALMGALCLDTGIEAVEEFIGPYLETAVKKILELQSDKDPKSLLQEIIQSGGQPAPRYKVVSEDGPDHAKVFEVVVFAGEEKLGQGAGSSKHVASMAAAENALKNLSYIR
ncbi:MAG TPA: ribonuclease III [Anaerolineales bacterium]|nr:ribonuclease III [Anaerolineales bacterium]